MKTLRLFHLVLLQLLLLLGFTAMSQPSFGQAQAINGTNTSGSPGRPVTIPVTIKVNDKAEVAELQNIDLTISEDGDPQTIISLRGFGFAPVTIAILIQDDLVPSVGTEIKAMAEFVRRLPKGSRVMVGYVRAGSLQVRQ